MTDGLRLAGVTVHLGRRPIVADVSLEARPGEVLGVLGPNGVGKSTLLRAMAGLLPCSGTVTLAGTVIGALAPPERARHLAYVPQRSALSAPLPVADVVAQGRFAHRRGLGGPARDDRDAVAAAMADCNIQHLAGRPYTSLSGGEQRRVLLARALATQAAVVLLDEPTAFLDIAHGLRLLGQLRRLAERGLTVVVVLHDLNEAARCCDRVALLSAGRLHAVGPAGELLAEGPVRDVFGVELTREGAFGYRLPEPS